MTLAQPFWLLLLLLLPALRWVQQRYRNSPDIAFRMPFQLQSTSWRTRLRGKIIWLSWIALALLVVAMARPQRRWEEEKVTADAVDIMLTMDLSLSMLSQDFSPDRLTVAKKVAVDFVGKRPYDRIGLVVFAREAFTQCPLTTDHRVVSDFIRELEVGRIAHGTAIGVGLATAVNRLKDSPARSKIIILLTDGDNLHGDITPEQAADIAQLYGIRVYTLGVGTDGNVRTPVQQFADGSYAYEFLPMRFDAKLLQHIAAVTGGKFYRAFSESDLEQIYGEIDRLEKTKIEVTTLRRTTDYFGWLLGAAFVLLGTEALLRWGFWRAITP